MSREHEAGNQLEAGAPESGLPAVYAIRYATRDETFCGEHFFRGDPHADVRMPID